MLSKPHNAIIAYHDVRFNPDIDKVTGFRTRTILCYPVLSSTNELLGVIQMVNKRKGDAKELRDMAKKKKSDETNKGECWFDFYTWLFHWYPLT